METLEQRLLLTLSPGPGIGVIPPVDAQEAALRAFHGPDLAGKDGPLAKIGFDLALLFAEQSHPLDPGRPAAFSEREWLLTAGEQVFVDVVASGDPALLQSHLAGLGMSVTAVSGPLVTGMLPIAALDDLAALTIVHFARPVYRPKTSAGSVLSQGDSAMGSLLARPIFDVDGSGLIVGVLSDSFSRVPYAGGLDGRLADIASGDLPANTQILQEIALALAASASDEGRGMAQLIHDVAPGAGIQFATAVGSEALFANNIILLANAGSDVIVDDIGYFSEPFFQDGLIARAAQSVVARGIPFVSAAGNSADNSYQNAFVTSTLLGPNGGRLHDFDPGPGVAGLQRITVPLGGQFAGSLQWDQPFRSLSPVGATSDLELALFGADGATFLGSTLTNNIGADPLEVFSFFNDGTIDVDNDGNPDTQFFLSIELLAGPEPGLIKYVDFIGQATIDEFATNSSTAIGHSSSVGTLGVAAAAFFSTPAFGQSPPLLNSFSALGGTPTLFDRSGNRLVVPIVSTSPQIAGPDGTNTTFFGQDIAQDGDALPNFFGTSAAAPHVAALVALMLDAAGGPGSLGPDEVRARLQSTAIDIVSRRDAFAPGDLTPIDNGVGFDLYSGAGLVDAVRAIQSAAVTIDIENVSRDEGDAGTVNFVFAATIGGIVSSPATVAFATADDSAQSGTDFTATSGTLTFTPGGSAVQFITVQVLGDSTIESNETFGVRLSSPVGARLATAEATGTIINDDLDFSVNDISVVEGNAGSSNAVFTIAALGVVDRTVSVSYSTQDGSARAGSDYLPRAGAVTFAPGGGSAAVTVPIVGDTFNEVLETFSLVLASPQGGRIVKGTGIATIVDNDPVPSLYVNDVQLTANEAGQISAVFTVALDVPSGETVTVHYGTDDLTAVAPVDYLPQGGVLSFAPGVTTRQVTVPVIASGAYAPNKQFALRLTDAVHSVLNDPLGIGTLVFGNPPPLEHTIDDGDPGYSRTNGWVNLTNTLSHQLDYEYHAAGSGAHSATWTFDSLPGGAYEVFTRWIPFGNRATNAPYTLIDGNRTLASVSVNQQVLPVGHQAGGAQWQSLGVHQVNSGTLAVRLSDNANGLVVADAVRIVAAGAPPASEMDVAGSGQSIGRLDNSPSLVDGTDFGSVGAPGKSATRSFTIANTGNANLLLSGSPRVSISGAHPGDFSVLVQPGLVVAPGGQTTFQLMFHPTALGLRTALVTIANNDGDEGSYSFAIRGTGVDGTTVTTIDNFAPGYRAIGDWTTNTNSLSLAGAHQSAPAGGGSSTASWTFQDLAPGQYAVYATWVPFGNRASAAPFTIADGTVSQNTIAVNQQLAPNDLLTDGVAWEQISLLSITTGTLTVGLANTPGGFVIADAVRIVRQGSGLLPLAQPAVLHNAASPLDVNGDTRVTGFDALLVIGELLNPSVGASSSAGPLVAGAEPLAAAPTRFIDVTGDGRVTPRDALTIISHLLNPPRTSSATAPQVEMAPSPSAFHPAATSSVARSALDQALTDSDDGETAARAAEFVESEGSARAPAPAEESWSAALVESALEEDLGDSAEDSAADELLAALAG